MQIHYDYYRIFYFVAKYHSFSAAAKVLYLNQPNITRTIKKMEEELGCTLFHREKYGVTLTKEGEKLFSHIAVAYEHIQLAEKEIREDQSLQSGEITISTSEIALHCTLLPVLKAFHQSYPNVRLHVSNHTTPQAINVLKGNLADLAIVTTPLGSVPALEETKIRRIHEIPVCGKALQHLQNKPLPLADFTQYPLISLGKDSNSYAFYSSFFSNHGLEFSPTIEVSTADQILPMVKNDLGIGFVPEDFLHQAAEETVIPLSLSTPVPERNICLLERKGDSLNIATQKLKEMVLDTITF